MTIFDQLVSRTIMHVPGPMVSVFARKYIAGEVLEDALELTRRFNAENIMTTIDVLGEFITNRNEALYFKDQSLRVLQEIESSGLRANLSIKPTQMGLQLDYDFARVNIEELVAYAQTIGNFIRIDMEDVQCTDLTLKLYRQLRQKYPDHVGTVLQAYLRRTAGDIEDLADGPLNIRLCKGIYREPRALAFKHPEVINMNFSHCLDRLLARGAYVGIATHDSRLVYEAMRLIERYGLPPDKYEFQMLLGVDEEMRRIIVDQGHRLRVYVPFGRSWLPYARRRLKENPDIARHGLKQILGLQETQRR
ncbi:MAG: proline dehydrogenase family protein [Desulfohalobiaceae bacterium]|nr:proline dehydrogenase family protein [Desulfohalobiaceae bacterium]